MLRDVRAHFGFSQPALARWLGLSRSLLALVETGREQLPAHARAWLYPWLTALALPDDDAAPPPPPPSLEVPDTGPTVVLARLRECNYQAYRLHLQHVALLARHRTAARHLAAGPLLLAALPPPAPTEPPALTVRRRWLARLLEAATDTLRPETEAGPLAATLLGIRSGAYRHEAAVLRAWLAEGGG